MLNLDNVTLYSVDCKYYEKTILAIEESLKQSSFKEVIYFSNKEPINLTDSIKWIKIRDITSLGDYSRFIINELPDHINTDFCMSVHHDGWIINADNWRDEFLDYDYIGAPWPEDLTFLPAGEKYRVGNGGVSIRSKRLMLEVKKLLSATGYNEHGSFGHEDILIAHSCRLYLESLGINFAPLSLAKYFSQEHECSDLNVTFDDIFAFHGSSYTDRHKSKMQYITDLYNKEVLSKLDIKGTPVK